MNTSKIKKIVVLSLIIGLIFIQILNPKVSASGVDFQNLFGDQMGNEIGNHTNLSIDDNKDNNMNNQATNIATNKQTELPKTGANENIIITMIIICAISGVYAYKKVKEYNV